MLLMSFAASEVLAAWIPLSSYIRYFIQIELHSSCNFVYCIKLKAAVSLRKAEVCMHDR